MKSKIDRIKKLSSNFAVLLEQEQRACHSQLDALIDALQTMQGNSADRRLQRIALELKSLKERNRVRENHRDIQKGAYVDAIEIS